LQNAYRQYENQKRDACDDSQFSYYFCSRHSLQSPSAFSIKIFADLSKKYGATGYGSLLYTFLYAKSMPLIFMHQY
jgi:hypothetical protein